MAVSSFVECADGNDRCYDYESASNDEYDVDMMMTKHKHDKDRDKIIERDIDNNVLSWIGAITKKKLEGIV